MQLFDLFKIYRTTKLCKKFTRNRRSLEFGLNCSAGL